MGGYGSGNRYRRNKKATLDDTLRLDIRTLKRLGFLRPGYWPLYWSSDGHNRDSIGLEVESDHMMLRYQHCATGGDWQAVREVVMFDFTACHYGGKRTWFLCPRCQRRVGVLYSYRGRFLCRHCHGLHYGCQQETDLDRMYRKTRKIRRRLGGSMNLPEMIWRKPKGMHWATFQQLKVQERQAEAAVYQGLAAILPRRRLPNKAKDDGLS